MMPVLSQDITPQLVGGETALRSAKCQCQAMLATTEIQDVRCNLCHSCSM